ncbi:protein TOPLESS-RELATED PROTEIN 2-like isoform X2 [Bidens hawaiensis]|uniref:protein TOPLESS-RELATED PROTEIN 2-like isoform X2 n=1 Tax=Bidens hawaiensis TaxID=980011 RepID=UPI00404A0C17
MFAILKHFEQLKIKLEAIKSATDNFAEDKCIGKGGFGKVYKGQLLHDNGGAVVAIKRLDPKFGQGNPEFWKEIIMLSQYKHENIVTLFGFCDEKILVCEYASKGSLDMYLNNNELTWIRRLKICIGVARGLAYLHNPGGTQQRVLHRDIKSSNILLDENWKAKISDLGLAKLGPANQQYTFLVSHTVGTIGYCDPLYVENGLLTKESDVYSFGVVLFEILCGRLSLYNKDDHRRPLTGLVREYYQKNKINEIIYGNMQEEMNPKSVMEFTTIAYQCLNTNFKKRPLITEVVTMLEKALEYQAYAENSMAVDTMPRNVDGENNTIIVDSSHLRALCLPDRKAPNKVMQLIYTNSGSGLLVLALSGLVKLWQWQQNSSASMVPRLWHPVNGALMSNHLNETICAEESVACIALTKNDSFVLSASGGKISLFDMMASKALKTFMSPPPAATCLALHPQDDNTIAIGMENAKIEIYNISYDRRLFTLKGHRKRITGLAFSQALNSLVSSGADARLCIWNTNHWEKLKSVTLQLPHGYPSSLVRDTKVQYHNDQKRILVVHESQIAIYDSQLECLKLWYPRESLSAPISSAIYSCDSLLIFTGFLDGAVGVFDAESLKLRCRIPWYAYISPSISSNSTAYPMVVAAHPSGPSQFSLGMSDGSVHVIEPADAYPNWGGS